MSAALSADEIRALASANLHRLLLRAEADHADLLADTAHADLAPLLGECQAALAALADMLSDSKAPHP